MATIKQTLMVKIRLMLVLCLLLMGQRSFALEEMYQNLVDANLNAMIDALVVIEASQADSNLTLFQALVDGELYANESNTQLLTSVKGQPTQWLDVLTGQRLERNQEGLKKLRINNRVRGWLRGSIARAELSSSSAQLREKAVRALFSRIDPETLIIVKQLRIQEENTKVKATMDLLIAMDTAQNNSDTILRLQAIEQMSKSLEPTVRNTLVTLSQQAVDTHVAMAANLALQRIEERTSFYKNVDTLFFGLSLGSVLLLAAIGLAITFGVMGVINMAHGEMIMLGAYTTFVVQQLIPNAIDLSLWVAIPAAFLVSGAVGIAIERGVIRHLQGRPLETLLATFGISLILQQTVRSIFSPLNRQVSSPSWMSGSFEINPVLSVTLNRFYIFIFALLVFFALVALLRKSSLGLHVRAVSQNRNMARAMGINTAKVDALTFGLGSGIAGIAGVALSQITNVGPNLGQNYIIDSFLVVVFGGVGNLLGTLVAAFTLGIATKMFEPVTGSVLASILVLIFIILFIQKRPKGLFPQKGRAAE